MRSAQYDKAQWRYLKSYSGPTNIQWPTENDMRWDAMVGLVHGYTGHTWFLLSRRKPRVGRPAPAGTPT
ncbi:MAG: hypothetical protein JRI23_06255 [Deltaproteobacteria bacterium]|nr:hypothetical protein [Deltaproteobacteria bacterium]MBW2531176.1 hypothetical protein [Deltaproteobacteria bacterium]